MALPAVLGIGAVLTWLGSISSAILAIVGGFMAWLASRVGKRIALLIALGAVFLTAFLALIASIETIMATVTYVAPYYWSVVQTWIIPDNFALCVSAIISVKLTIWFGKWSQWYFEKLIS